MTEKPRYHHGDLRSALLQAAIAILEEGGLDALSLRAVAARAGVSHAAPAHHFATLKALLTAVAADAFRRFAATMQAARDGAPADPRSQLAAAGDGYVQFARACPQQFRLMFSPSRLEWTEPGFHEAGRAAYAQLQEVCAPVAELRGEATPEGRAKLERMVWSSVHGYVQLLLAGQLGYPYDGSPAPPPRPDIEGLLLGPKRS
jgi:AcrR family transcriptional regulator